MSTLGPVGGNSSLVMKIVEDPVRDEGFRPGDTNTGAVIDAHSTKAGDFTEQRTLPGGQNVFLTTDGAKWYDYFKNMRIPSNLFQPMVFKDGDSGLQDALKTWVSEDRRSTVQGVGKPSSP